jgi:hypothetical protein
MSKNLILERVCPSCNILIKYKSYQGYNNAIKNNRKCKKCGCGWMKGKNKNNCNSIKKMGEKVSNTWKKKFDSGYEVWNKGKSKNDNSILEIISQKKLGQKHTEETKKIISFHSKMRWEMGVYDNQYSKKHNEFRKYQSKVHKLTKKIRHLIEGYDEKKHGISGKKGAYQIDHIIDIKYGFDNNIPVEVISDINNLRFIPWEDNLKKGYYGKSKN